MLRHFTVHPDGATQSAHFMVPFKLRQRALALDRSDGRYLSVLFNAPH